MNKKTEIVMVLDRSGSMADVRDDTIGGVNTFIDEQQKLDLPASFTLVLFNNDIEKPYDGTDLKEVQHLTEMTYIPIGGTSLLDALGTSIAEMEVKIAKLQEEDKPQVIIAVFTDGQENGSREWSNGAIKNKVTEKLNEGWEFLFLSATLDSFSVGASMGFVNSAMLSKADIGGSTAAYSAGIAEYRGTGTLRKATVAAMNSTYLANEAKNDSVGTATILEEAAKIVAVGDEKKPKKKASKS